MSHRGGHWSARLSGSACSVSRFALFTLRLFVVPHSALSFDARQLVLVLRLGSVVGFVFLPLALLLIAPYLRGPFLGGVFVRDFRFRRLRYF